MSYFEHPSFDKVFDRYAFTEFKQNISEPSERIILKNDSLLDKVLKSYESYLGTKIFQMSDILTISGHLSNLNIDPSTLDQFIDSLDVYKHENQFDVVSGSFITAFLKVLKDKDPKFDSFVIDLKDKDYHLSNLGSYLTGSNFNLRFKGNLGEFVANHSKWLKLELEGNVRSHFGNYTKSSSFNIQGDVGSFSFNSTNDIIISVKGDMGINSLSMSRNSIAFINGNVNSGSFNDSTNLNIKIMGSCSGYSIADGCKDSKIQIFNSTQDEAELKKLFRNIGPGTEVYLNDKMIIS